MYTVHTFFSFLFLRCTVYLIKSHNDAVYASLKLRKNQGYVVI